MPKTKKELARSFCREVQQLAEKYHMPFFVVTDGASATNNTSCDAVKNARDSHILWEKKNKLDSNEDWSKPVTYQLKQATRKDLKKIQEFKLHSIFDYIDNLTEEENIRIQNFVKNNTLKEISTYQLIKVENQTIGCLLTLPYQDGILIDEIYLIESYRNKGIGTSLLQSIFSNSSPLYLWVYQQNTSAIHFYQKLGFYMIKEEKNRYLMKRDGTL